MVFCNYCGVGVVEGVKLVRLVMGYVYVDVGFVVDGIVELI